ncbi:hypothetical protein H5410_035888, partial [Solanum commersonii]
MLGRPKLQTLRMLNAKVEGRWKRTKGSSPSVANGVLALCSWLARERGFRTKVFDLWFVGIGLTWVQLERVNPKLFPTYSARE